MKFIRDCVLSGAAAERSRLPRHEWKHSRQDTAQDACSKLIFHKGLRTDDPDRAPGKLGRGRDPGRAREIKCEAVPPLRCVGQGGNSLPRGEAETAARCGIKVPVLEGARSNSFPEFDPSDPSMTRAPRTKPELGALRARRAASGTLCSNLDRRQEKKEPGRPRSIVSLSEAWGPAIPRVSRSASPGP